MTDGEDELTMTVYFHREPRRRWTFQGTLAPSDARPGSDISRGCQDEHTMQFAC
jgi:hypothetical protein